MQRTYKQQNSSLLDLKNENTLVFNGDGPILCTSFLSDFANSFSSDMRILSFECGAHSTAGRIKKDQNLWVKSIIEFKDATEEEKNITEGNAGVYLIKTDKLKKCLGLIKNNNAQNILNSLYQTRAVGWTPITYSLKQAVKKDNLTEKT